MVSRFLRRVLLPVLALLGLAVPSWALEIVEDGGYHYIQIFLGGLWAGFFAFLICIVVVLVGIYLCFIWRRSTRESTAVPLTEDTAEEEDQRVF